MKILRYVMIFYVVLIFVGLLISFTQFGKEKKEVKKGAWREISIALTVIGILIDIYCLVIVESVYTKIRNPERLSIRK